jgi:UPF0755 protein
MLERSPLETACRHGATIPCRAAAAAPGRLLPLLVILFVVLASGCGPGRGEPVRVTVPHGASFSAVADSLDARGVIRARPLFRLYARLRGADTRVMPGTYAFQRGESWDRILSDLRDGRVLTFRLVIPEGWEVRRIAPRLASLTGTPPDSLLTVLFDSASARRYGVPGPNLEGYLYPATYTIPIGTPLDTILGLMTAQYRRIWTPERRARADSLGMSEREVITLASIVEKEARRREEQALIAGVFHNRLRIGYLLQADPTVQYARGEHATRLLFPHIEEVRDHPYNTYTQRGLPPGPIGSPSTRAVEATLNPERTDYLYFVARPDGSHIFTRTNDEHNRARIVARREWEEAARRGQAPAAGPGR